MQIKQLIKQPWWRKLSFAFLTLLAVASLFVSINRAIDPGSGSQDFQWSPSRLLFQGDNPYAAYLAIVEKTPFELRGDGTPFILSQHADYPVTGYMFLLPYAALAWPIARGLWALSNVLFSLAFLFGLFRLAQIDNPRIQLLLTALFVIGTPFRNGFGNGQHGYFSLAFFVWAVIWSSRNQWIAGLLLALSWLKYTLTFPLTLFFVVRRRYLAAVVAGMVHIVLLLAAGYWIGESPLLLIKQYLAVLGHFPVYGDFDIFGLLNHLGYNAEQWAPYWMLLLVALTTVAAFLLRHKDDLFLLSFLAIASCIVIVHHQYDSIVLLIPLIYLFANRFQAGTKDDVSEIHDIGSFLKEPASLLFFLSVLTTWYVRKIAEIGTGIAPSLLPYTFEEIMYFLIVLIFYGAWLFFSVMGVRSAWSHRADSGKPSSRHRGTRTNQDNQVIR